MIFVKRGRSKKSVLRRSKALKNGMSKIEFLDFEAVSTYFCIGPRLRTLFFGFFPMMTSSNLNSDLIFGIYGIVLLIPPSFVNLITYKL